MGHPVTKPRESHPISGSASGRPSQVVLQNPDPSPGPVQITTPSFSVLFCALRYWWVRVTSVMRCHCLLVSKPFGQWLAGGEVQKRERGWDWGVCSSAAVLPCCTHLCQALALNPVPNTEASPPLFSRGGHVSPAYCCWSWGLTSFARVPVSASLSRAPGSKSLEHFRPRGTSVSRQEHRRLQLSFDRSAQSDCQRLPALMCFEGSGCFSSRENAVIY